MPRRRTPADPRRTGGSDRAAAGHAGTNVSARPSAADSKRRSVERVQTGVRMEKRMLLVLKALAGAHDLSFGDLLEGIVLHAFEGKAPFGAGSMAKIAALREVYGLDLTAADSHLLVDARTGKRRLITAHDD